jgi:hypothetical protein
MSTREKEIKGKIERWLRDERLFSESIPDNERLDFGFQIKYPPNVPMPIPITIIKNKQQASLIFQAHLKIDENERALLKSKDPLIFRKFSFQLKKELLRQNFMYLIDNENGNYVITEILYDIDITKDQLMYTIRRVFNMFALMNLILNEILKGPIDPEQ